MRSILEYCDSLESFSLFVWGSLFAGMFIGIGASLQSLALASGVSNYLAACFFSIGLCLVRFFSVPLYTGKVGTFWEEYGLLGKGKAAGILLAMLVFNGIGAILIASLLPDSIPARELPSFDGWQVLFPAMLCGALVHIATRPERSYFGTVLCVVCFIVANGEHCIADLYHCARSNFPAGSFAWTFKLSLGNAIGSWLVWTLEEVER